MTQTSIQTVSTSDARRSSSPVLFIGGCPRSGTTLLQRMLDHHPDLAVVNDSHFVPRALEKVSKQLYRDACDGVPIPLTSELIDSVWNYHRFHRMGLDHQTFLRLANDCSAYRELVSALFEEVARKSGKRFSGEKTPDYIRHARLLWGLFPRAKIINLIRDGRDTALSLLNWAGPTKGPGRLFMWNRDPIATSALWWSSFVQPSPDSGTRSPYALRYEELLDDAEGQLTRLCEFLALPFSEEMLRFHQGKQGNKNGSAKRRWLPVTKGLRDWRASMDPEDLQTFELIAGDQLERWGYALSGTQPTRRAKARAAWAREAWRHGRPLKKNSGATRPSLEAESRVIQADSRLPALADLLSADQFQSDIGPAIKSVGHPVPSYVRYKPGRNCLVAYAEHGEPWGFCVAHRAEASDKLRKAEKRIEARNRRDRHGTRPLGITDYSSAFVCYRFPFDPKLPALADLVGEPNGEVAVEYLDAVCPGLGSVACVRALSYKPQRRAVLKLDLTDGSTVVLRLYAPKEYKAAASARKYMGETCWDPTVRLGNSDRHRMVLTDWIVGAPIAFAAQQPNEIQLAGTLLGRVHTRMHPKLPVQTLRGYIKRMHDAAESWIVLCDDIQARVSAATNRVTEWLLEENSPMGLTHGDFHVGQLLNSEQGLVVLDWDNAANAPVGIDVGSFVADCILRCLLSVRGDLRDLSEEFLDGYRESAQSVPTNIRAFIAAGLLRLGSMPFRLRHPEWRTMADQLLGEVEDLVGHRRTTLRPKRPSPQGQEVDVKGGPVERWASPCLNPKQVRKKLTNVASAEGARPGALERLCVLHSVSNRRIVIASTWATDDLDVKLRIIAKARKKGLDLRAFDAQRQLFHAASACQVLRLAKPLCMIPDWNAWLQTGLPGDSLEERLVPTGGVECLHHVGQALAEFHGLNVVADRAHTLDDELSILKNALRRLRKKAKRRARIDDIVARVARLLADIAPEQHVGIHRDFYPSQVLCDGPRVSIVDCDLFAYGHPAIDVGNFVAHLLEKGLREHGDVNAFEEHEIAFLDGYLRRADCDRRAIRILTIASLARLIYISRRIKSRRFITNKLINVAQVQLDDFLASE